MARRAEELRVVRVRREEGGEVSRGAFRVALLEPVVHEREGREREAAGDGLGEGEVPEARRHVAPEVRDLRERREHEPVLDAPPLRLERVSLRRVELTPCEAELREGERADALTCAMYLLLDGKVAVDARAPEGGFAVHRVLEPGHVFGAVALVADVPRSATCRALGPVTVASMDRRTFGELFRRDVGVHARFQLVIARSLAADLRDLRELLVSSLASGDQKGLQAYVRGQ